MDIMLSSHISIVSHSALFRFLWFRLFCFVLPCCVILCFGGIKPPWGGFIPPKGVVLTRGGGFIPHKGWLYPPKGVVLSPKRGGFIPHKSGHTTTRGGFKGGFIPHLGVVLRPGPANVVYSCHKSFLADCDKSKQYYLQQQFMQTVSKTGGRTILLCDSN